MTDSDEIVSFFCQWTVPSKEGVKLETMVRPASLRSCCSLSRPLSSWTSVQTRRVRASVLFQDGSMLHHPHHMRCSLRRCEPTSRHLVRASEEQQLPANLRPYQEKDVALVRKATASGSNPLYVLPTGGGKTVVMAALVAKWQAHVDFGSPPQDLETNGRHDGKIWRASAHHRKGK